MNSTPTPSAPLVKRYIKFPQGRKFDMLFEADPHPQFTLVQTCSCANPLPLKGGGGSGKGIKLLPQRRQSQLSKVKNSEYLLKR